jgi:predicted negative regulator of RcsB-dependent stress response
VTPLALLPPALVGGIFGLLASEPGDGWDFTQPVTAGVILGILASFGWSVYRDQRSTITRQAAELAELNLKLQVEVVPALVKVAETQSAATRTMERMATTSVELRSTLSDALAELRRGSGRAG